MSLLYPRLLPAVAKPLFVEYSQLSIEALRGLPRDHDEGAVFVATGGARVTPAELRKVRSDMVEIASSYGFPSQSSTEMFTDFDLSAARYLHAYTGMVAAEAASGDIWAFFALIMMPDIAFWRFPSITGDRFLATDITRHVFGRLWWRAHLTIDTTSEDPYAALDLLNESEIDQIYARRTSLGASSFVVTTILKVWAEQNQEHNRRAVLRDFLKRLLRLAAFTRFDAQSEDELTGTLRRALGESVDALGARKTN